MAPVAIQLPSEALPLYKQIPVCWYDALRNRLHLTILKETKHDLDWADLATLDLSEFDSPGGKRKLAHQLSDAIQKVGRSAQLKLHC